MNGKSDLYDSIQFSSIDSYNIYTANYIYFNKILIKISHDIRLVYFICLRFYVDENGL